MSFKTRDKIFISFAVLLCISLGSLYFVFGSEMLRQRKAAIFDLLSSRARLQALEIEKDLKTKISLSDLVAKNSITVFNSNELISSKERVPFEKNYLLGLAPVSGSLVTECTGNDLEPYLCSFSLLSSSENWLFQWTPQPSIRQILKEPAKKIGLLLLFLSGLAFIAAFYIARKLAQPLKRYVEASKAIAFGNYGSAEMLEKEESDEFEDLRTAFQKMNSEIQTREESLKKAGLQLAQSERLATLGQLGASIAHEVKNPLMAMKGYAKFLTQNEENKEKKEAAEIIQKESDRCNQILQQMLRFARPDGSERKAYSIQEVITATLLLSKAEAKKRQVELVQEKPADALIFGNAHQIQQVLLNLILNALHASPPNTKVRIWHEDGEKSIRIHVQDEGTGIPEDIKDKIFEPFFSTKEKGEGSGLGLAIVSKIVFEQGGYIEVSSQAEVGSDFILELPLAST